MPDKASHTIEIFRAGTHRGIEGKTVSMDATDLQAIARAYDPAQHEAPLVVGHPKIDEPAYGWVTGLSVAGDRLVADVGQVDASFAETVNAGRFKNVSASFYTPGSANNPTPGQYALRHVGFLGATAPAVKGLKTVSFADEKSETVEIPLGAVHFSEDEASPLMHVAWAVDTVANLIHGVRDSLIERDGVEKADAVISKWRLDWLREIANNLERMAEEQEGKTSFAENNPEPKGDPMPGTKPNTPTEPGTKPGDDPLAAERAELEADRQKLDEQRASFAEAQKKGEAVAWLDGQVKAGRVLPAEKDQFASFMASLDGEQTVSFADGDGKSATAAPLPIFKAALEARKVWPAGEAAPAGDAPVDLAEGDEEGVTKAARQLMKSREAAGESIFFAEAVSVIQDQQTAGA